MDTSFNKDKTHHLYEHLKTTAPRRMPQKVGWTSVYTVMLYSSATDNASGYLRFNKP